MSPSFRLYICYFSHCDNISHQSNLNKGLRRSTVSHCREGVVTQTGVANHMVFTIRKQRMGKQWGRIKAHPQWPTSSSEASPLKYSRTFFGNSSTKCAEAPKPRGDISRSNHSSLEECFLKEFSPLKWTDSILTRIRNRIGILCEADEGRKKWWAQKPKVESPTKTRIRR